MMTSRIRYLKALPCWLSIAILITVGSCDSSKTKTGKFTEEEMATIPLAKRHDLPRPSGGLVLSINTETVAVQEIVSPLIDDLKPIADKNNFQGFREQVRKDIEQVVLNKITDILVYQEAKKNAPDNIDDMLEKAVGEEVNRFIASYDGNYVKAQSVIKSMGMDWRGFRDYQKKLILIQSYMQQEMKDDAPVTHSDLLAYYNTIKEERYQWSGTIEFSLIDIQPDKLDLSEGTEISGKEAALKLAGELLERINEGLDFGELAKEYSHGHRAAEGGKWEPVTIGSLVKAYEILESQAQKLQPGQVSAIIESDDHIFIMKLQNKKEAGFKSFEEAQGQIEAEVRFLRQRAQFNETISMLMEQTDIRNREGFIDFCIEWAYRQCRVQ